MVFHKGYTNKEIADRLHTSVKTVEAHRAQIVDRLNCHLKEDMLLCVSVEWRHDCALHRAGV